MDTNICWKSHEDSTLKMALIGSLQKSSSQERSDLVAYWSVPLIDGTHTVEFEHGTTSGKRVLRVDGKEILRRDWMFRLVGSENFTLGKNKIKCVLDVEPLPHFTFGYNLYVDGKPLEKFTEKQLKTLKSWGVLVCGKRYRVVIEKQRLEIWVNGQKIEAEHVFTDVGTEMRFLLNEIEATIKAVSTDKKGVIHELFVDGDRIEDDTFA